MDALALTELATTATLTGWTVTVLHTIRLYRALHTDPLTGLGNRAALHRLHRNTRHSTRTVGLLLCDLDRFKAINDTHGHDYGNRVLADVAARLARESRPGEHPIRLHGDEFALWLGTTTPEHAQTRARQITAALTRPLLVDEAPITAPGSVGAATAPGRTPLAALLTAADHAMYQAKTSRRLTALATPSQPGRTRDQHRTA